LAHSSPVGCLYVRPHRRASSAFALPSQAISTSSSKTSNTCGYLSPWVEAGTLFRSNTNAPLDHTSILATLREWLAIPSDKMLTSQRIAQAPTLDYVLTRTSPRVDKPIIQAPETVSLTSTSLSLPLNDLHKGLITGTAARFGMDPRSVPASIRRRQHAIDFFTKRPLAPAAQKDTTPPER
jgi:phospholipase C